MPRSMFAFTAPNWLSFSFYAQKCWHSSNPQLKDVSPGSSALRWITGPSPTWTIWWVSTRHCPLRNSRSTKAWTWLKRNTTRDWCVRGHEASKNFSMTYLSWQSLVRAGCRRVLASAEQQISKAWPPRWQRLALTSMISQSRKRRC